MVKLGDLIAEQHTDKRGTCVKCSREDIPKDPQLSRALDKVAESITNKILGRDTEPKD